jgi:hypothetical protein
MFVDAVNRLSGTEFLALAALVMGFSGLVLFIIVRYARHWLPAAALWSGVLGTFILSVAVFAPAALPLDTTAKLAALCVTLILGSFHRFTGSHISSVFRMVVLLFGFVALVQLTLFQMISPQPIDLLVSAAISISVVMGLGLVGAVGLYLIGIRPHSPTAEDDKNKTHPARPNSTGRSAKAATSSIADSRPPTTQVHIKQVAAQVNVPSAAVYNEPKGIQRGTVKQGSQMMLLTRTEDNQWAEFASGDKNYWIATNQLKIIGHLNTLPSVEFS